MKESLEQIKYELLQEWKSILYDIADFNEIKISLVWESNCQVLAQPIILEFKSLENLQKFQMEIQDSKKNIIKRALIFGIELQENIDFVAFWCNIK